MFGDINTREWFSLIELHIWLEIQALIPFIKKRGNLVIAFTSVINQSGVHNSRNIE